MRNKEKIMLGSMVSLFLVSAGFYVYTNFYTNVQANKNKVPVIVATKNIENGISLNKNNTAIKKVDKTNVPEGFELNESDLKNKVTNSKIYKDEMIGLNRLKPKDKKTSSYDTYTINVQPSYSSDIQAGDLIKVYVQVANNDGEVVNKLVFKSKEVLAIEEPDVKSNIDKLVIEVTDKEAVAYYNAVEIGNVIALKYKDIVSEADLKLQLIEAERLDKKNIMKSNTNQNNTNQVNDNKTEEEGVE